MKNKPGTTSTSLLIRLRQRDSEAWDRFDAFYLPLVEYWCAKLRASDRKDIAQLVAVKVHQNIDDFQRQRTGSFRKWLRRITKTQIAEFCRQPDNKVQSNEYIEGFAEPTEQELSEELRVLHQSAVKCMEQRFSEQSIRCFYRVKILKQPAKEIADELGMTSGAVTKAAFTVLKRLREEFGDFLEDQPPQRAGDEGTP